MKLATTTGDFNEYVISQNAYSKICQVCSVASLSGFHYNKDVCKTRSPKEV